MAKKKKAPLTKAQKAAKGRLALYVILAILLGIGLIYATITLINAESVSSLMELAVKFNTAEYAEGEQLVPVLDDDGDWCFVTDGDFTVMQLTDVHIGGGIASAQKDIWAMNAVASMVTTDKPDLVVVTGDVAYPVPFSSLTFNNFGPAKVFAAMMDKLGVYWTLAFGNHDTEAYSYYTREQISAYYAEVAKESKYFLYQEGPKNVDGCGNQVIKVKGTDGVVTQAIVTLDSHSYTDGDVIGIMWKYDNIHQNQVDWYANKIAKINTDNRAINPSAADVKSLAFFHIPLVEYRDAWAELSTAEVNKDKKVSEYQDTENVKYIDGDKNEDSGINPLANNGETYGVFCGMGEDNLFETGSQIGLQGVFCGHDHKNNFSVEYKGMRLTYGMSVDYLAYAGIWNQKAQRGCTLITIKHDGSFSTMRSNYYQDKYKAESKQ